MTLAAVEGLDVGEQDRAELAAGWTQSPWRWRISRLIVAQVDSMAALSKHTPAREYDGLTDWSVNRFENSRDVYWADSIGGRSTRHPQGDGGRAP